MRPAGAAGVLALYVCGLVIVAAALAGGAGLHLWNTYGTFDSVWLYVAIGGSIAAPAIGYVARSARDVQAWVALTTLAAVGFLIYDIVVGPSCPKGGDCGTVGAWGAFGIPASGFLIALLALGGWYLGTRLWQWADERRNPNGRTRVFTMAVGVLWIALIVGVPLGATVIAADALLRPYPKYSRDAILAVNEFCYSLDQKPGNLEVRPSPQGLNTQWATYLVRQANETRPALKGAKLPGGWHDANAAPYPYEAVVAFDKNGDLEGNIQMATDNRESGMTVARVSSSFAACGNVSSPTSRLATSALKAR